jgi:hypothetical protein
VIVVADLFTYRVVYHPLERVNEDDDSNNRCDGQHVGVVAEPRKVDTDFDPEVVFDVIEGLVLVAFLEGRETRIRSTTDVFNPQLTFIEAHFEYSKCLRLPLVVMSPSCSGYAAKYVPSSVKWSIPNEKS